jgi:hypothetical protein
VVERRKEIILKKSKGDNEFNSLKRKKPHEFIILPFYLQVAALA